MGLKLFSGIVFLLFLHNSTGLKCYICSCTENDADQTCADDVLALGDSAILDCDKKYCLIQRVDYLDPKGKLASISRNCADKVDGQGVVEDETHRTYTRTCKDDLCNGGSGKGAISPSNTYLGDKSTIYVKGSGKIAGAASIYASVLTVFSCVSIVFMQRI